VEKNMSHFTKLKTKITDKVHLLKALKNLQYTVEENSIIRGYNRRTRKGDIVVKTQGSFDVGFVKGQNSTYEIVADWYGAASAIGKTKRQFANEVQKEYAVTKVLHELRKKGFRIRSRFVNDTGEIKLLVVKQGWTSR
jgi:hypothetical protein